MTVFCLFFHDWNSPCARSELRGTACSPSPLSCFRQPPPAGQDGWGQITVVPTTPAVALSVVTSLFLTPVLTSNWRSSGIVWYRWMCGELCWTGRKLWAIAGGPGPGPVPILGPLRQHNGPPASQQQWRRINWYQEMREGGEVLGQWGEAIRANGCRIQPPPHQQQPASATASHLRQGSRHTHTVTDRKYWLQMKMIWTSLLMTIPAGRGPNIKSFDRSSFAEVKERGDECQSFYIIRINSWRS